MRFVAVPVLAVALACSCATADFREPISGAGLVELCTGKDGLPAACVTYIDGVRAGMRAERLFLAWRLKEAGAEAPTSLGLLLKGEPFCIPPTTPIEEIARSVVTFVKASKTTETESAAFSIIFALKQAYPCHGTDSP